MSMHVLWSCAHPEIKEITPNYDKQNAPTISQLRLWKEAIF